MNTTNYKATDGRITKDFMEWFVSEYEGYYLPTDYDKSIYFLEGYAMAKRNSEEYVYLMSVLNLLKNAQTLLRVIKQLTNWKYRA